MRKFTFYITYEELKPGNVGKFKTYKKKAFYITYEELKQNHELE